MLFLFKDQELLRNVSVLMSGRIENSKKSREKQAHTVGSVYPRRI